MASTSEFRGQRSSRCNEIASEVLLGDERNGVAECTRDILGDVAALTALIFGVGLGAGPRMEMTPGGRVGGVHRTVARNPLANAIRSRTPDNEHVGEKDARMGALTHDEAGGSVLLVAGDLLFDDPRPLVSALLVALNLHVGELEGTLLTEIIEATSNTALDFAAQDSAARNFNRLDVESPIWAS